MLWGKWTLLLGDLAKERRRRWEEMVMRSRPLVPGLRPAKMGLEFEFREVKGWEMMIQGLVDSGLPGTLP